MSSLRDWSGLEFGIYLLGFDHWECRGKNYTKTFGTEKHEDLRHEGCFLSQFWNMEFGYWNLSLSLSSPGLAIRDDILLFIIQMLGNIKV
jgi:hypothetical protein